MFKNKKGFTLIELLVVIAIIAILASIALFSLAPAQKAGKDARRIADLRQVQSLLQLYYNKCGFYPNGVNNETPPCIKNAGSMTTQIYDDWSDLEDQLQAEEIITQTQALSKDPTPSKNYYYGVALDATGYVLGAELETDSSVLRSAPDEAVYGVPCSRLGRLYCVEF